MTSVFLEAPVLRGDHVVLEPLAPEHEAELAEAVKEGEQWRLWVTRIPSPQEMAAEVRRRLTEHEAGTMVPWTVRDARTRRAVGMTTYMNVRPDNRRLEIGSTWLALSAQRTAVACHLANLSLRLGRKLRWDGRTVRDDAEAARALVRPYRAPWDRELKALRVEG